MIIAIPSYRRHSNCESQTLEHLPREIEAHLFVRPEESDAYIELLTILDRPNIVVVPLPPEGITGIATTRNAILDWCLAAGQQKVCMVDDDLHFIVRGKLPENDVHLRPCEPQDTIEMFQWIEKQLDDYAHAAVSMREGNNREPGLGAFQIATRGIRVVGYSLRHIEENGLRFREEVEGREDLDMTLQLLRLGLPNIVTFHWAQGQRKFQQPSWVA